MAAIQMNSRDDKAANLARAAALVQRAARAGARLVALPEMCNYLGPRPPAAAEPIPGPSTQQFREWAVTHGIYLHCGSIPEEAPGGKAYNTTVVYDPRGEEVARYRKIHLYDVRHQGGEYRESATIAAGDSVVTLDVDGWRVGLTICYDVRFPELYRALAEQGAHVLMVPAAFTLYTGKDHWEVLQRARAIENQAYVVAPAQFGSHPPGNQCFGNAMVVDPWGTVIARAREGEDVVLADLDMAYLEQVRARIPALEHRAARFGGPITGPGSVPGSARSHSP